MFRQAKQNKEAWSFWSRELVKGYTLNQNYPKSEEIWPLGLDITFGTGQILLCWQSFSLDSHSNEGTEHKIRPMSTQCYFLQVPLQYVLLFYRLLCSLPLGCSKSIICLAWHDGATVSNRHMFRHHIINPRHLQTLWSNLLILFNSMGISLALFHFL